MVHHNIISWIFPFEHFVHGHYLVGFLGALAWALIAASAALAIRNTNSRMAHKSTNRKYVPAVGAVIASFLFVSVAAAMCPVGFVPPGRIYHPDNNTRGLLVWERPSTSSGQANGLEKLIIEPSFTGNAKDFGLIMPTPSRPELTEAPENIFKELEDLTNPIVQRGFLPGPDAAVQSAQAPGVVVVEQKDVGDYTASVLTADSASALIDWLTANGYVYSTNDKANIDYYVAKLGFHFVALKVNMAQAKVDASGMLSGRLRPIEFSFTSPEPMLPIRSMASDMEPMNFTVYTLSGEPYYIPGADVLFSKKLAAEDIAKVPSLDRYTPSDKWLVRNSVLFDPRKIEEDLNLHRGGIGLVIPSVNAHRRVNPHLTPLQSGVVEAKTAVVAYVQTDAAKPAVAFPANLGRGARGEQIKLLQIILRDVGGIYPEGLVTGYYGPLTSRAVARFQELYRHQVLSPIGLSVGTGFTGVQTRLLLNQLAAIAR